MFADTASLSVFVSHRVHTDSNVQKSSCEMPAVL